MSEAERVGSLRTQTDVRAGLDPDEAALLQTMLDSLGIGVHVFDRDRRLRFFNAEFERMLDFPPGFLQLGDRFDDLIGYLHSIGRYGDRPLDEVVRERVALLLQYPQHRNLRPLANGRVLELWGHGSPTVGTVTSYRDISKDHDRSRALEAARRRAERASIEKDELLDVLTHEMRNPLNGLSGLLERMPTEGLSDTQREILRAARSAGSALSAVLDQARTFAQSNTTAPAPIAKSLDLGSVLHDLVVVHRAEADLSGATIALDLTGLTPGFRSGDAGLIRQVMSNLVVNAIKHGGTAIRVSACDVTVGASLVELAVEDSGEGIVGNEPHRIFEPYMRGPQARASGLGLGLFVARRAVHAMDGDIWVGTIPGGGASFRVRLPLPPAEGRPAPMAEATSRDESVLADRLKRMRPRILAADDVETNRFVLGLFLSGVADLVCVRTGEEALEAWRRNEVDLMLLDLRMPGLDGDRALEIMRREAEQSGRLPPKALLVTADTVSLGGHADLPGVVGHLIKPFTRQSLLLSILDALELDLS